MRLVALIALLGFLHVAAATAQTAGDKSLDEVNKELSNPISNIWALQLQENTYWLNRPDRNVVNLQFQPVLPLALTDNWNLITRPVFQVMNSTPYVNESGHLHRVTGFGDTILATLISSSPKLVRLSLEGRKLSPRQIERMAETTLIRKRRGLHLRFGGQPPKHWHSVRYGRREAAKSIRVELCSISAIPLERAQKPPFA
jgi:hypothetical protein